MVIKVYITSVSANATLKKNQQTIIDTLTAKNIPFEAIDISSPENEDQKKYMREQATPKPGQAAAMPPQLFVDDKYIGDYDAFYEATEDNNLDVFFQLAAPVQSSQATVTLTQPTDPVTLAEEAPQTEEDSKIVEPDDELVSEKLNGEEELNTAPLNDQPVSEKVDDEETANTEE